MALFMTPRVQAQRVTVGHQMANRKTTGDSAQCDQVHRSAALLSFKNIMLCCEKTCYYLHTVQTDSRHHTLKMKKGMTCSKGYLKIVES